MKKAVAAVTTSIDLGPTYCLDLCGRIDPSMLHEVLPFTYLPRDCGFRKDKDRLHPDTSSHNEAMSVFDRVPAVRAQAPVAQSILVKISSRGGSSEAGLMIHERLREMPAPLTTYGLGCIESAALTIFCAGDRRIATPNSRFLMHLGKISMSGVDAVGLRSNLKQHLQDDRTLAVIIARATGKPERTVMRDLRSARTFNATEALNYGLVTDIVERLQYQVVDGYISKRLQSANEE